MNEILRLQELDERKSKRMRELAKKDAKPVFETAGVRSSFKDEEKTFSASYMS